jgi:hypothetical protein
MMFIGMLVEGAAGAVRSCARALEKRILSCDERIQTRKQ